MRNSLLRTWNMITDKIKFIVISAIAIGLVIAEPQFEVYKILEVARQNGIQTAHFYTSPYASDRYQNHPFKTISAPVNKPELNFQSAVASCDDYWSYQIEPNEKSGLVSIQNPNYQKSFIRLTLSIAARLPSVSV